MTDRDHLPMGPMPPLPPPPGSLDRLLHRAKAHRARRRAAVAGTAAAILLLAVGLPLALRSDSGPHTEVRTADDGRSSTTTTAAPTTTAEVVPGTTPGRALPPVTFGFRGRAIDPEGHPIAGLYVYEGDLARGPSQRTAGDGTYAAPCPSTGGVVLSGAVLNTFVGDHAEDQNWAPTSVVPPSGKSWIDLCTAMTDDTSMSPLDTTVQPGGTITGHVYEQDGSEITSEGNVRVTVGVDALTATGASPCPIFCFWLEGLTNAAHDYTIVGVPTGARQLTLDPGPSGVITAVRAGEVAHADLHLYHPPAPNTTASTAPSDTTSTTVFSTP
jgi:hypothetical protein